MASAQTPRDQQVDDRDEGDDDQHRGATVVAFFSTAVVLFAFFATSLFLTLPPNVVAGIGPFRAAMNSIAGENFAFFTKSPQDTALGVYQRDSTAGTDGWRSMLATPQGRPSNLYGLSRTQRAQGPELAILSLDSRIKWMSCDGNFADCIDEVPEGPFISVTNSSTVPTICGRALLTQEGPVAWSYRHLVHYSRRVLKMSWVDVRCPRKKQDR